MGPNTQDLIDLLKAVGLLAMMLFCFITACALVYVIK
jgi:hypothetical protein